MKAFLFFVLLLPAILWTQDVTSDVFNPVMQNGCSEGEILLYLNGGQAPYNVLWYEVDQNEIETLIQESLGIQGVDDGEDITNLPGGNFRVYIEDAYCGVLSLDFPLTCECAECTFTVIEGINFENATCESLGWIEPEMNCQIYANYEDFSYLWSDGVTEENRYDLFEGVYSLTVTDEFGCEFFNTWLIEGGGTLEVVVEEVVNIQNCDDLCSGRIDIEVIQGGGDYTFEWSHGATTQNARFLCEGNYSVTVTDANGCQATLSGAICCCRDIIIENGEEREIYGSCYPDPENAVPLSISGTSTNIPNPSIETTVSGGTGNFVCTWTGPGEVQNSSCDGCNPPDVEGWYCLKVDDGCEEETICFEIVNCAIREITVNEQITNTCIGLSYGRIALSIIGNDSPYSVEWSNGNSGSVISNLAEGEYCATIFDDNGCEYGPYCYLVEAPEESVRVDCELLCLGVVVEDFGPVIQVTNPIYCDSYDRVCSQDGSVIESEIYAGIQTRYNFASCNIQYVNAVTDDICETDYGQWCNVCFFEIESGTPSIVYNCEVNYCYFSSLDISWVSDFTDFNNSVVYFEYFDQNYNCTGKEAVVYDYCNNHEGEEKLRLQYGCDDDDPIEQNFCAGKYPINTILDGDPFGGCGGLLYAQNSGSLSSLIGTRLLNKCNKLEFAFDFHQHSLLKLSIKNLDRTRTYLTLSYTAKPGINKGYISNLRELLPNGKYVLEFEEADIHFEKGFFEINCNPSNTCQELSISPNPFDDSMIISGFGNFSSEESVFVQIFNLQGIEVLSLYFEDVEEAILIENFPLMSLGTYYVHILSKSHKAIIPVIKTK